jgi:hypothetical protein
MRCGEIEAAPAGGESGGRVHGSALGGWAESVLQGKLIHIGLICVSPWIVTPEPVQANYNTYIPNLARWLGTSAGQRDCSAVGDKSYMLDISGECHDDGGSIPRYGAYKHAH